MHYNTFEQIQADAEEFKRLVETSTVPGVKVKILQAGDILTV